MAIRPIGNKKRNPIGVVEPARTISVGAVQFTPVVQRTEPDDSKLDGSDNRRESNDDGAIDPTSVTTDSGGIGDTSGTSGKRRGRKPGSRNRTSGDRPASTTQTTNSLATLVCMLHGVAANMVKIPQLAISLDASRELTAAAIEVSQLYDVPLPTEKVAAWMNLGAVAYKVYIVGEKTKGGKVQSIRETPEPQVQEPVLQWEM